MVSKVVEIAITVVSMVVVASVLFLVFLKTQNDVSSSGPRAINGVIQTFVLFGPFAKGRKKGIELSVNLVATIILLLAGAVVLFVLFSSVAVEQGGSIGTFVFNMFDVIVGHIPLVGGG